MTNKNNTGIENTGDRNSGNRNSGNRNSGNWNSGDWNSGYRNSGDYNSGDWNSGNRNSGYWNSGNWNSGYRNSGNWNSGYWNSGNWNSGNRNSGYWNSGNWNSGDYNSGYFNTDTPCVRIFNVQTDITFEDFQNKYNIYADIPLNHWVNKEDMTDKEKSEVKGWEEMGGYLKTLEFKEACQIWWNENPEDHNRFLNLPHFNAQIFEEITGINVEDKSEMIEIEGTKYTLDEIKRALKK